MTKSEILARLQAIDDIYQAVDQDVGNVFADGSALTLLQLFAIGTNVQTVLNELHKLRVQLEKEVKTHERSRRVKELTLYAVFRESDDTDTPEAIYLREANARLWEPRGFVVAPFIVPADALTDFYRSGRMRYRKWFAEQVRSRLHRH